jgi:rod shape determining protein RodA
VVGVTLPLFSYGGSSVVTTMIGIGLLMNVSMRRFHF